MTDDSPAETPAALANVAARAVGAAGESLSERFRTGTTDAEYTDLDVKTAADRVAENRVLTVLREAYPAHPITAEESGDHAGAGDYRWWVDALDGTNNYSVGLPTFGVAVTACDDDGPVATAVGVPLLDDLYVATRGGGVGYNEESVVVTDGDTVPPSKATVAKIIGPPVLSDGPERREWAAISDAVDAVPKRTIESWAPVVHWGLFARGKIDAFVCYYPPEREHVAGRLLAREANAVERSDGPLSVFAADERTRDVVWDAASGALE